MKKWLAKVVFLHLYTEDNDQGDKESSVVLEELAKGANGSSAGSILPEG